MTKKRGYYMVPMKISGWPFHIWRSLVEKAGFKVENLPKTWDPFLDFFIRQPVPGMASLPGHMDLLIEIRNLLAQGYVPVVGQDHRTVYLVQSARAVRGGVAFNF